MVPYNSQSNIITHITQANIKKYIKYIIRKHKTFKKKLCSSFSHPIMIQVMDLYRDKPHWGKKNIHPLSQIYCSNTQILQNKKSKNAGDVILSWENCR